MRKNSEDLPDTSAPAQPVQDQSADLMPMADAPSQQHSRPQRLRAAIVRRWSQRPTAHEIRASFHDRFMRWLRKVWEARGGGLYAVGFAVFFLYLEAVDIVFDDLPKLFAMNWLSLGDWFGFLIEFVVDTLANTVQDFIWPALAIAWQPPIGAILLAIGLTVFPRYCKAHVEQFLLGGAGPSAAQTTDPSDASGPDAKPRP